jgi:hypothetical protein
MNAEREHGCADADDDSRRSAGQQLEPAHATAGCVCTETTIAVPVPSASASKARIRVVTFMTSLPKADNGVTAFSDFFGGGNCLTLRPRATGFASDHATRATRRRTELGSLRA